MEKFKRILVATSNKGKFREMMEVLGNLPYEFVRLDELNIPSDCEENADSFEGNALLKARYYWQKCGLTTISEDSGILVDALEGELGIKTRRWGAGEKANDEQWIRFFLDRMSSVPFQKRGAKFVCCSAIIDEQGAEHLFRGETPGIITDHLEAPIYEGLPLSSCFKPVGLEKVYAALTPREKNEVSHRGKAMKQVHDWLLQRISP
jgi:XTP/dITP diphosphohydrolase